MRGTAWGQGAAELAGANVVLAWAQGEGPAWVTREGVEWLRHLRSRLATGQSSPGLWTQHHVTRVVTADGG